MLGPVEADDIGRALVHEHIIIKLPGAELDPAATWDRAELVARGVAACEEVREHGVTLLVDPCPVELGRDPEVLAEVAQRSGLDIVCATGFYVEREGFGIPYYWRQRQPGEIAEFLLHELEHGIGSTGIRPGVIKVATSDPVGRHERKVLEAAGMAAAEAGVAVITHTENSAHGDVQLETLVAAGCPPERCLIGHQDTATVDVLGQLAAQGAFVGIDRIGHTGICPDADRVELVCQLLADGRAGSVCLSQDRMCNYCTPRPPFWVPAGREDHVEREVMPRVRQDAIERGFTHLLTDFVPALQARGIDDATIEQLLVGNPRRLLTAA